MSNRKKVPVTPATLACIKELLGKSPLLRDEHALEYEGMLSAVATALTPGDIVESILAKDFVDCTWEIRRAGRYGIDRDEEGE